MPVVEALLMRIVFVLGEEMVGASILRAQCIHWKSY